MELEKYIADEADPPCVNGAVKWYASAGDSRWLARIERCPTPFGPLSVFIQGPPESAARYPAACKFMDRDVLGVIDIERGEPLFVPHLNSWVYPHIDEE